jgi:hypothetical protein
MAKKISVPALVGSKIKAVRAITKTELKNLGMEEDRFGGEYIAIELETGVVLAAQRDPEGNGMGCMIGMIGKDSFYIQPETSGCGKPAKDW